jgi:hypothetical protein
LYPDHSFQDFGAKDKPGLEESADARNSLVYDGDDGTTNLESEEPDDDDTDDDSHASGLDDKDGNASNDDDSNEWDLSSRRKLLGPGLAFGGLILLFMCRFNNSLGAQHPSNNAFLGTASPSPIYYLGKL